MKLNELEVNTDYFQFDEKFYEKIKAQVLDEPFLISYNKKACDLISLDYESCESNDFVKFLNGEYLLKNSIPYSMAYSGHQFGYFVPNLGDGRVINLGSINSWHLQTKGSGTTIYSRQGDGRAVLRSSIREYIISEAMHGLDIPTTRALALLGSNHPVYRGYGEVEKAAIVLRMSTSWIRIGTFEYFARTKNKKENVEQLANYVIKESYPHLEKQENKYEKMFYELVDRTALMISKWQVYGFVHGVMNTDNFSIAGLTIDYGPFAFMDYFEKNYICNDLDEEGRYSFNNQPIIAKWNLEILAYSLEEICDIKNLLSYLETFMSQCEKQYLEMLNERIGLDTNISSDMNIDLIKSLLETLEVAKIDYNCFFYNLSKIKTLDDISSILDISLNSDSILNWFEKYKQLIKKENLDFENMKKKMQRVNPKYIIKNYMLQEAIEKAENGDFSLVNSLLQLASKPFDEHREYERFAKPTPYEYSNLQLSCSS